MVGVMVVVVMMVVDGGCYGGIGDAGDGIR